MNFDVTMEEQNTEFDVDFGEAVVISGGTSVSPDTSMSDTSTNAVQNKVIKAYVDAREQTIYKEVTKALKNCTTNDQFNATVKEVVENYATKQYVDSVIGGIENGSY